MPRATVFFLLTLLLVVLPATAEAWQGAGNQIEVGKPYPDFVLPRIDNGQPLRLSDYRGRKVILVHFASW